MLPIQQETFVSHPEIYITEIYVLKQLTRKLCLCKYYLENITISISYNDFKTSVRILKILVHPRFILLFDMEFDWLLNPIDNQRLS